MLDQDTDYDGNNIVPCPICGDVYCESNRNGGYGICPEEEELELLAELERVLY